MNKSDITIPTGLVMPKWGEKAIEGFVKGESVRTLAKTLKVSKADMFCLRAILMPTRNAPPKPAWLPRGIAMIQDGRTFSEVAEVLSVSATVAHYHLQFYQPIKYKWGRKRKRRNPEKKPNGESDARSFSGNVNANRPVMQRVIFAQLEKVYGDNSYIGDWSDEKVADLLHIPVHYVAEKRKQFFGPGTNADQIATVREAIAHMRQQLTLIEQVLDK